MAARAQDQQGFPILFFSYAHTSWDDAADQQDADLWAHKFYDDLCAEIERLVDTPQGQDSPFIDRGFLEASPQTVAEKLSRCAVFIPLYSRDYFRQPDCGREWSIIRRRQNLHLVAAKSRPNIIVPVLWGPVRPQDMPVWPREIDYAYEELGHAYTTYGLQELLRVKDHQADYRRSVRFLARRIVDVAGAPDQLRPLREIPDLESLPDEFAELGGLGGEAGKVRITVLALDTRSRLPPNRSSIYYGSTGLDWIPYLDPANGLQREMPVVRRASDVARQHSHVTEVTELTSRSEELRTAGIPTAPTIMLVDPWTTQDRSRWILLDRLDKIAKHKPWIRIIIPWNTRDPETLASANLLHSGIDAKLGYTKSQGRIPSRRGEPGPADGASFVLAVSEALRIAFSEFLRQSPKYLPAGPYPGKPRLGGPVGMGPARDRDFGAHPDSEGS